MLAIYIQRHSVPASADEAGAVLAPLAAALASNSRSGLLWARLRNEVVPFDAGTIRLLLDKERLLHLEDTQRPTHVLSLCATPDGVGEVGVISVNVRPNAAADAAPGLSLTLSLPPESFDTSTDSLRRLLDACLDAVSADLAMVGPHSWLRELRAGWATFTRAVHRELLPAGAEVIPTHDGSLIVAHREDPASASTSAREAIAQVRASMERRGLPPSPRPLAAPLSRSPAAPVPRRDDLRGTALALDVPRRSALPFSPEVGPSAFSVPGPIPDRAPADLRGTSLAMDIPRGPGLPFSAGPKPPPAPRVVQSAPDLTVEQYAMFRARLTVRGEADRATRQEFGVTSDAVKSAIQARFAALFREQPAEQERFLELVRQLTSELREQSNAR